MRGGVGGEGGEGKPGLWRGGLGCGVGGKAEGRISRGTKRIKPSESETERSPMGLV